MSDIIQYRSQVSPGLPKGPSPFQLIAGFPPPDTQVADAAARGIGELGGRIEELAIKITAADQNTEVARGRADYFSKMKDWTLNLERSDLDPKEYRQEFDRQSNAIAGDISKGFRYADSHDQFSIWKTEQDVPLLGETLQKQLTVMNDRAGATLLKSLEILQTNPNYLPTVLTNINDAERSGAKKHAEAEELRQHAFVISESAQIVQEGEKIGSAAMVQRLQDRTLYTHVSDAAKQKAINFIESEEQTKKQGFIEEDRKRDNHFEELHIRIKSVAGVDKAMAELRDTPFFDGGLKNTWEGRFTRMREDLLRGGLTPAEARAARDDWFQQQENNIAGEIAIRKANGQNPGTLRKLLEDSFYRVDDKGEAAPLVRGNFVEKELGTLERQDDPGYVTAMKAFSEKTKGLKPEEAGTMAYQFSQWLYSHPEANDKEKLDAATSITSHYVAKTVNTYFKLRDTTAEAAAGKYAGTAAFHPEDFASYAAYALKQAQTDFPKENLITAFTDSTGRYGAGIGAAMILNGSNQVYGYKVENGELQLYRLGQRRDGTYSWGQVIKASTTGRSPAEQKLFEEEQKRKAAAPAQAASDAIRKLRSEGK